ncbi:hypothetical protein [Conexibacter sp. SYSU D00693]|uniref:hypothetical protein n=1 Tax=Conexibacter sp. SYSU D00693 TaxID=2812560 RepID=UPI00196B2E2E|nr:hypothetical protein [Conexibacter sp. SYSU D00693]
MTEGFELLRLAAEEVAEGVCVVELEGRWPSDDVVGDAVRLCAGPTEVTPVPGSAGATDGVLRARFVLPPTALAEDLVLLAPGIRVRLPEPDDGGSDRLAQLARELNRTRRERDRLEDGRVAVEQELAALRGAAGEAAALRREREQLQGAVAELEAVRRERDELSLAVKELEAVRREREHAQDEAEGLRRAIGDLRRESAARQGDLDEARAEVARLRDELERLRDREERVQPARARVPARVSEDADPDATRPFAVEDEPDETQPMAIADLPDPEPRDAAAPGESVRVIAGPRSPRRRAGMPEAVPIAELSERPRAVYFALAGFGVLGLLVVLLLLL